MSDEQETPMEHVNRLMKFYSVNDWALLILKMEQHINKLQARVYAGVAKDDLVKYGRTPREG